MFLIFHSSILGCDRTVKSNCFRLQICSSYSSYHHRPYLRFYYFASWGSAIELLLCHSLVLPVFKELFILTKYFPQFISDFTQCTIILHCSYYMWHQVRSNGGSIANTVQTFYCFCIISFVFQ